MRYRLLDLRFCPKRGVIDDEPLQRLLHGHRVLSVREHFYTRDNEPHVLLAVCYALGDMQAPPAPVASRSRNGRQGAPEQAAGPRRREDWREILQQGNQPLFDTLRSWRSARARRDAVPPYVILTNAQLAHVANARPESRAGLREIKGLGDARVTTYGEELLAVIHTGVLPEPSSSDTEQATP